MQLIIVQLFELQVVSRNTSLALKNIPINSARYLRRIFWIKSLTSSLSSSAITLEIRVNSDDLVGDYHVNCDDYLDYFQKHMEDANNHL